MWDTIMRFEDRVIFEYVEIRKFKEGLAWVKNKDHL